MKRKDLLDALKKVLPGVEEKTVLDGANSFMFAGDWIKTFSDSISVSYRFKTDLTCLVKASELYKVLNKAESEEVKVVQLDETKIQITAGKTTIKMNVTGGGKIEELVDNLSLQNIEWKKLPSDFIPALTLCAGFACASGIYASLCGVSVAEDGLMASDNFRAIWYHTNIETDQDFIVPVAAVKELVKNKKICAFALGDSWLHFKDDEGLCFSCRRAAVEFPRKNIERGLDFSKEEDVKQFVLPKDLLKSVERAAVFESVTQDGRNFVSITKDKRGDLVVTGEREFGELKERIAKDDSWDFPAGVILNINPVLFGNILSLDRKFYLNGSKSVLLLKGKNFECILSVVE